MPQYAVLIYPADGPDALESHDRHAVELRESGALVAAFALEAGGTATAVRGDAVTDGTFVETKEVIAGFYVIEAPDLDAALRIASRNPAVRQGGGVEVRPVAGSFIGTPAGASPSGDAVRTPAGTSPSPDAVRTPAGTSPSPDAVRTPGHG